MERESQLAQYERRLDALETKLNETNGIISAWATMTISSTSVNSDSPSIAEIAEFFDFYQCMTMYDSTKGAIKKKWLYAALCNIKNSSHVEAFISSPAGCKLLQLSSPNPYFYLMESIASWSAMASLINNLPAEIVNWQNLIIAFFRSEIEPLGWTGQQLWKHGSSDHANKTATKKFNELFTEQKIREIVNVPSFSGCNKRARQIFSKLTNLPPSNIVDLGLTKWVHWFSIINRSVKNRINKPVLVQIFDSGATFPIGRYVELNTNQQGLANIIEQNVDKIKIQKRSWSKLVRLLDFSDEFIAELTLKGLI